MKGHPFELPSRSILIIFQVEYKEPKSTPNSLQLIDHIPYTSPYKIINLHIECCTVCSILLCRMLDYRESKTTLEQSRIDQYNIILLRVLLYRLIHSHKGINFETQSAGITTDNILANKRVYMK